MFYKELGLSGTPLYAKIGFVAELEVLSADNDSNTGIIFGLAPVGILQHGESTDFYVSGFSAWMNFSVAFSPNGAIRFNNNRTLTYVKRWSYTMEVVLDPYANRWELRILNTNLTAGGPIGRRTDLDFRNYLKYLFFGLDGTNPSVSLGRLGLFYCMPTFKVAVPTSYYIQAGQTANITVDIETTDYFDSHFDLAAYVEPPGCDIASHFSSVRIYSNSESNLSVVTSRGTTPGMYPVKISASYYIQDISSWVNRSNTVNLIVGSSSVTFPLWNDLWFWLALAASITTVSSSLFLVRMNKKQRISASKDSIEEIGEQEYTYCRNHECGYQEVPIDSEFCPICGKKTKEE